MASVNEIRQQFLSYFDKQGHSIVPSAPLVPFNDPTLLFTNAGMVPFKSVFTGQEKRDYVRATSSQKCVRAGGKHNDLDNVGYTARHHTFFEMLGNFSFGDYFKEDAIFFAWDLITKGYGLDPARLLVTVYSEDEEAAAIWRKVAGFSDDKIIRISTSDNFWSMGDTGPCGPCSEIFFDHGDHIAGGPPGSPDEDGDRFIEIWNLVFMQYEQRGPGDRVDLPRPSIDTGMGLERIAAVLQGEHNNYDIDTFQKLIRAAETALGEERTPDTVASYRVIADHLRAASFLIADGVMPSSEGRGYVLRRIMRRAMRHAHILGSETALMHQLVPALVGEMGEAFPELGQGKDLIAQTLRLEEEKFRTLLDKGLGLLDTAVADLAEGDALPGDVAFKLYDTYGFPYDLTEDAMRGKGIAVDRAGFDAAMADQKARARAAWAGSGQSATDTLWFDLKEKLGSTEFVGYTTEKSEGEIVALIRDGEEQTSLKAGEEGILLTNQTPFYGESGGQMGDTGAVKGATGSATVSDTGKALGALHTHQVKITEGTLSVGDVVELEIDAVRRDTLRANHSATHLLHAVLRNELGEHVTQKGSLVAPDRLRFDISHPQAITLEERRRIEIGVNALIRHNDDVLTRVMSYDDALDAGALALFGEKYGDEVRVLSMGDGYGIGEKPFSVELCGGTHVRRLGDIGTFVIISESSVSAGVRRLEALTGDAAVAYLQEQENKLFEAADILKAAPAELVDRIAGLVQDRKALERELADTKKKLALAGGGGSQGPAVQQINGVKFMGQVLDGISPKDLRGLADDARAQLGSGVAAFVAVNEGKAALLVTVTDDLTDTISAVDLIRSAVGAVGGKGGGGKPGMAQAGGPDGAGADNAIKAIEDALAA